MKKALLGACALALLAGAGCANNAGPPAPQLTFAQYQPIVLNVQSAGVSEQYINPNDPQNMASQFVVPPAEAIKRYAAQRYRALPASSGNFDIVIEDARVHMRQIAQESRVLEWSGVGQEDEYRLILQLRVTPQPEGTLRVSPSTIKMERTLVMPSSVTLAEREQRQIEFLEKLIADLDVKMGEVLSSVPSIR